MFHAYKRKMNGIVKISPSTTEEDVVRKHLRNQEVVEPSIYLVNIEIWTIISKLVNLTWKMNHHIVRQKFKQMFQQLGEIQRWYDCS